MFFADKVVLVEGISDRLVLSSLLESTALLFQNSDAIEVIEVGGKGNCRAPVDQSARRRVIAESKEIIGAGNESRNGGTS